MSRQLFPLIESSGGGGSNKKTSGLGTYGNLSLTLAINFGLLNQTIDFTSLKPNNGLLSNIITPLKKDGAKINSHIGAIELT